MARTTTYIAQTIKKGEHVAVKIRAELGFLNEKPPETFMRKPVYVCLLVELSDGHLVHFARIRLVSDPPRECGRLTRDSGKKLNKGQEVLFGAKLTKVNQLVHAYLMCDSLGKNVFPSMKASSADFDSGNLAARSTEA